MRIAEVRGMLIYLGGLRKIEIKEPTPLEIKTALTGYGKADKKQVEEMVKSILKLESSPSALRASGRRSKRYDDEFDAIAVALTCSAGLKNSLK
jgi:crossover junction endodeoxyribonuclease RuvC